jgi:hypothetical protein
VALREDKAVAGSAVGGVTVPERFEAGISKPVEIAVDVGMVPEHTCSQVVLNAGPPLVADNGQQVATRDQPLRQAGDQTALVLQGYEDERIEADDRVEAACWTVPHNHVGTDERGFGNQRTRTVDLHRGDIDACDLEPGSDERPK